MHIAAYCAIIADMKRTCAFTGNRPEKLPWGYDETDERCKQAKSALMRRVTEAADEGFTRFISGMAQGGDVFFAECVLELKKQRGDVILECAIPYKGQAERWSRDYRLRYEKILTSADCVNVLSAHYSPWCMHARNRYMVDKCERLLTLSYGKSGGTEHTIEYAKSRNKEIIDVLDKKIENTP